MKGQVWKWIYSHYAVPTIHAFMLHWRTKVLGNSTTKKKTILIDNEVAGNIVSWQQDGRRLIGYWIGSKYWGQGIATSALAEFLADHEKTRPVYAYVAVQNVASVHILEKCGFRCVGDAATGPDGVEELLMQLGNPAATG